MPVANPTYAAVLTEPTSTPRPAKREPAQAIGDGPRRGGALTLTPRAGSGVAKPSTRRPAAPAAGKPGKKPATKPVKKPPAGGPATSTTAPAKPKGNKTVAPGKVKKSKAVEVNSAPVPTTTTSPLKGKGHDKKP